MRVILNILLMLMALSASAQESVSLLVVHTNDTHSCIMPLNPQMRDTLYANKAGYARRNGLVSELRKEDTELLLFDCGDFSQGSAFYSVFKGEVEIKLMNQMRYDAATIGNHEFDFKIDNMARIFRMAEFPILCCNYDFTGTELEGLVKPYTVLERKGVRVGVLAVCPRLEGLVASKNIGCTKYLNPVERANEVASYLKGEEKCDLVICLSHLGWKVEGVDIEDSEFIASSRNIDVVLGGHTHTLLNEPLRVTNSVGESVTYNQMGKNGQFVGTLGLEMVRR